jgi:hypothetical protein
MPLRLGRGNGGNGRGNAYSLFLSLSNLLIIKKKKKKKNSPFPPFPPFPPKSVFVCARLREPVGRSRNADQARNISPILLRISAGTAGTRERVM